MIMSNLTNLTIAKDFYSFGIIPVPKTTGEKRPRGKWKQISLDNRPTLNDIEKTNWSNSDGICIICGAVSNNLEVLDFDNKSKIYRAEKILHQFMDLVYEEDEQLATDLIIIQTPSGGFHIPYFAKGIEGNQKLAQDLDNEVLIETRGEGGLVVSYPSAGYVVHQGDTAKPYSDTPFISEIQRNTLIRISKSFNKKIEKTEVVEIQKTKNYSWIGQTPFDDFNSRGNALDLLNDIGLRSLFTRGKVTYLKRDGTKAKHSGYYFNDSNILYLFSTSTIFEAEKGYNQSQILAKIKFNDDFKETFKFLIENGYGDKQPDDNRKYTNTLTKTETKIPYKKPYFELAYEFREQKLKEKKDEEKNAINYEFSKLLKDLKPVDYTQKPQTGAPVLFWQKQSKAILREGEILTIKGKSGSRKTELLNALIGMCLNPKKSYFDFQVAEHETRKRVLRFETEQSALTDFERTNQMSVRYEADLKQLVSYRTTTIEPKLLRKFVLHQVKRLAPQLKAVVIDGAMDLILNPNDLEESQRVIMLIKEILATGCVLFLIMHENETKTGTTKMVGHLGSYLKRKSEVVLQVEKVADSPEESIIRPSKLRNVNESLYDEVILKTLNVDTKAEETSNIIKLDNRVNDEDIPF